MSNFMKTAIAVIVLAVVAVVAYQWFNPEDTTVEDAMQPRTQWKTPPTA